MTTNFISFMRYAYSQVFNFFEVFPVIISILTIVIIFGFLYGFFYK